MKSGGTLHTASYSKKKVFVYRYSYKTYNIFWISCPNKIQPIKKISRFLYKFALKLIFSNVPS